MKYLYNNRGFLCDSCDKLCTDGIDFTNEHDEYVTYICVHCLEIALGHCKNETLLRRLKDANL